MSDESKLIISVETQKAQQNNRDLQAELEKTEKAGDDTKDSFDDLTESGDSMGEMLKQLAAGFTLLKFIGLINDTLAWGDSLQKTSIKIDITTDALSQLHFVADQTGVAIGTLEASLATLSRRTARAAQDVGPAVNALEELNINAKELAQLSPDQQLFAMAVAFEDVASTADKSRLAFEIFGQSGTAMVQMLGEGVDGIQDLMEKADLLGLTLSQDTANAIADFNDTVHVMQSALIGGSRTMVEAMIPALQNLADAMFDAEGQAVGFNKVFEWIGQTLASVINTVHLSGSAIGSLGAIVHGVITRDMNLVNIAIEQIIFQSCNSPSSLDKLRDSFTEIFFNNMPFIFSVCSLSP